MIIFDLACEQEHFFEGWFHSPSSFDSQLESGLISCPHCGTTGIRRVPSAVHLTKSVDVPVPRSGSPTLATQEDMFSAYKKMLSAITLNFEDVAEDFAQEVRRIHYMDAPLRSIRGEASSEDCESLLDEGIEILRLPALKKDIH